MIVLSHSNGHLNLCALNIKAEVVDGLVADGEKYAGRDISEPALRKERSMKRCWKGPGKREALELSGVLPLLREQAGHPSLEGFCRERSKVGFGLQAKANRGTPSVSSDRLPVGILQKKS